MRASWVVLMVQSVPADAGDARDTSLIPGWGRSLGRGHVNLLQYSCLENPMGRGGIWWATVHGVTKSNPQLKQLSTCDKNDPNGYSGGKDLLFLHSLNP